MAKKQTARKTKKSSRTFGLQYIFGNETTNFILGITILLVSIVMIIAMFSYISTASADQSILENMQPGEWLNNRQEITNVCGSFGAIVSHFLIYDLFGIPAFFVPLFLIIVALKLMRVYTINLWNWFFCIVVVMMWSSVTVAKFINPLFSDLAFNIGGNFGQFCVTKLENMTGSPGLTAILLIIAIVFLTYLTNETIVFIRKIMHPVSYISSKVKFSVTKTSPTQEEELQEDNLEVIEHPITDETEVEYDSSSVAPTDTIEKNNDDIEIATPIALETTIPAPSSSLSSEDKTLTVDTIKQEDKASNNVLTDTAKLSTPINPLEPFTKYKFPSLDLLNKYDGNPVIDKEEIIANNKRILEVLESFGVKISKINATVGPTVTLYEITPAEGVRISKIRGLEDDIALTLSALGIRIIAPIPGKGTIGIEVPNKKPQIVSMESVLNTKKFQTSTMALPMALGKTITNEVFMVDLTKIPHLLVAGATGQGKSVGLNAIITSLLYKKHPNEMKFVLVDPKKVEFSIYNKIAPHYMAALPENEDEPIITDVQRVVKTLNSLCKLMDHRYDLLKKAQVKKIDEYNDKFIHRQLRLTDGHDYMPYIVVIIDEFGDLIMTAGKEIELPIQRIAQLARAVGIHMIIATQRPTTKIITGNIKANFPGRMAFRVTSQIDSRTILDGTGADRLIGRGDMLFLAGGEPIRLQCAFIDTPEIQSVSNHIEAQPGPVEPMELPEPDQDSGMGGNSAMTDTRSLDPYFEEAARAIVVTQQGSTSLIQRRFSIGYNRAGRLMDQLEAAGIVGAAQGSKPREVMITDENSLNRLLEQIRGGE